MAGRVAFLSRIAALTSLLALAACNRGEGGNVGELDNSLVGNGADPALTSALEDQILVDPNLVQQANPNQAHAPQTPVQAQYPADGAAAGAAQGHARQTASAGAPDGQPAPTACGGPIAYGNAWANRLPAEFPAYPGGRVTEAAGSDRGDCHVRVVSFTTADPFGRVIGYYRGLATRAGFSAEQQARGGDQVLGGTRGEAAYYLIVTPRQSGSDVSLIVNNGR